jgi:ABC-type uncharacterized transport system ATPase subunit
MVEGTSLTYSTFINITLAPNTDTYTPTLTNTHTNSHTKTDRYGVPQGQCFGFLGVNGAGKTTTMEILTGK